MSPTKKPVPPLYPNRLGVSVTMIGAGGIGSNVRGILVKAGVTHLTIWDDDIVAPVNLAMQEFDEDEIGKPKAESLALKAALQNSAINVRVMQKRFAHGDFLDGLVVCGVDSMAGRRIVFNETVRQAERVALFIDGRLSRKYNHWAELYFIDPKRSNEVELYREWLFDDPEGAQDPRPNEFSAHTPIILAGLMGAALARWALDRSHPWKVTFDAASMQVERYHL